MKCCRRLTCYKKSLLNGATGCLLLVVALVLYSDPFLILWWPEEPAQKSENVPGRLDMATDSIDDMYEGCQSEAAAMIDQIGVFEWYANKNFTQAWALVEQKAKKPTHEGLRDDHSIVIYMYTDEEHKRIRRDFHKAAKTGKSKYKTYGFTYHYLYFYLTDAIRVLRPSQNPCRTTYHRTGEYFDRDVVNKQIRFGTFTLSSLSKDSFESFGSVSCFEIYTCFGAEVTWYSAVDQEGQVLIPPYEVFKVTHVQTDDQWCKVVYRLRSTKVPRSDVNCKYGGSADFRPASGDSSRIVRVVIICISVVMLIFISLVLIRRRQKHFVAVVLSTLLVLLVTVMMWKFWGGGSGQDEIRVQSDQLTH